MVVVMINLVVLLDGGGGSRGDYDGECEGDAFGSWVVVLAVVTVVVKVMVLLAIVGVMMVVAVVVVFNGMCWYGGPFGGCDCDGEGDGVAMGMLLAVISAAHTRSQVRSGKTTRTRSERVYPQTPVTK